MTAGIIAAGMAAVGIGAGPLLAGCGGGATTVTQTVRSTPASTTPTLTSTVPNQGTQRSDVPQVPDIRSVDWATMLGVAADANSPGADKNGYLKSVDYHDFTGSGHNDQALVQIGHPGGDALLDYYVFVVKDSNLTAILQRNGLVHGKVTPGASDASIQESSGIYAAGDPACCPSSLDNITWTWDPGSGAFVKSNERIVPAS